MQEPRRPAFAEDFPRTADLDEVVGAFARGDYARVRAASDSARTVERRPDGVRKAARALFDRTRPDPLAVALLVIAGLLLVTMATWWIAPRPTAVLRRG
jgi:hypothetical protein